MSTYAAANFFPTGQAKGYQGRVIDSGEAIHSWRRSAAAFKPAM
jgi:hypothetical protein